MVKKICLWFAHPAWNRQVKLAYNLSDKVITSVPEAFRKRGGKVHAIGQGIDTELFENTGFGDGTKSSILSLGRISPSKNIHILIEALRGLKESGVLFTFTLVGSAPQMPGAAEYDRKIKDMIMDFDMADASELHSAVPYGETVNWYNKNEVFVNLSPTGHFDKTVLEAMASGCITLASNDAYYNIFPQDLHGLLIFKQGDADDLAQKLKKVLEFVHENEMHVFGDRCDQVRLIADEMRDGQTFKLIFDFDNYHQSGDDVWDNWLKLRDVTDAIHLKDSDGQGQHVPVGQGGGRVREILVDALKRGWSGPLSLEPHLKHSNAVALTGPHGQPNESFSRMSTEQCFLAAAEAAIALLGDIQAPVG